MKKNFFGPRKGRGPGTPAYGYFLKEEGTSNYGLCFLSDQKIVAEFYSTKEDAWEALTSESTPSFWYSSDLNQFLYDVVLNAFTLEELLEKVITSKAKEAEKLAVVPKGDSDMMRIIVRQAKKKRRSKKLHDITFLNVENLYPLGHKSLATDFGKFFGTDTFEHLLLSGYFGLVSVHDWIATKLKVRPSLTFTSTILKSLQTNVIEVAIPPLPKEYERFIKRAIIGGQVELYQMLMPNCYQYDKNGGFGEASALPLPMKGPYVVDEMTIQEFMEEEDLGYIKVDVYVSETLANGQPRTRGPLPYKTRSKRTLYPVGTLKNQVYFTPLLKEAVKSEEVAILKIHGGIFFTKSGPFLEKWARYTAELKQTSKCPGEKKLASLAQQTLWGKFNQEQTQQIVHIGRVPKERLDDENVNWPDPMLPVWYETVEVKLPHYLPHIAGAISSWAHVIGMKDIAALERYGLRAAYRDTDSWFLSDKMPAYMQGTALGTYRLEHGPDTFLGISPKLYFWLDAPKIKAKAKGLHNFKPSSQDVQNLLKGIPATFEWNIAPTLEGAIVAKYHYEPQAELFKEVIEALTHRKITRTLPGAARGLESYLQLDTKRKQLSLTESRPLHVSEVD